MNDNLVLIDTSIWIEYLKSPSSKVEEKVEGLLNSGQACVCEIILAELLQGAKSEKEIAAIEDFTSVLSVLEQRQGYWTKAGQLAYKLKKHGITIHIVDCLLAVIANENHCAIYTHDKHFKTISKHYPLLLEE